MSAPQNDVDSDESSGVTSLRPVPVKPARYADLAESDSTQYFSASQLLERGKALAARGPEPAAPLPEPDASPAPEPSPLPPLRAGLLAQFRAASFPRQAIALLLPLIALMWLLKPARPPETAAASAPSASVAAPLLVAAPKSAAPVRLAPTPLAALPHGATLAHAAADSVATGDFAAAASFYRELARREPSNQAYAEAARILAERAELRKP
jgi:hypothetical protein